MSAMNDLLMHCPFLSSLRSSLEMTPHASEVTAAAAASDDVFPAALERNLLSSEDLASRSPHRPPRTSKKVTNIVY